MTEEQVQSQSIQDLKPKMQLNGVVKETYLYGAVVDLGLEYDGMVHISQLSPKRVNRVADVVEPGDDVTVWVTDIKPSKGRIGLTMVKPPDVTWSELKDGQVYTGSVTRLESYGAFIDIGAERPGLLHVREMSSGYVRHPSELVSLGEDVEVRVVKVDRRRHRIDLSMLDIHEAVMDAMDDNEEPTQTAMEVALQQARSRKRTRERRGKRKQQPDLSEREDILARTLKEHAK